MQKCKVKFVGSQQRCEVEEGKEAKEMYELVARKLTWK